MTKPRITYKLFPPHAKSNGQWEWYAVIPGHTREWAHLNPNIPANHVYVRAHPTEQQAREYGRAQGWCE